jgi:Protease inhibitor Inh
MPRSLRLAVLALALSAGFAQAQPAPPASDTAQAMVGAWELSNAERDKRCAVTFSLDPVPGGLKLELDPACAAAFPQLRGVAVWTLGRNDVLLLLDGRGTAALEFTEVEHGLFEGERKGEGLFFLQTMAAIKAETRTADEMFGEWKILREADKTLCTLTLSKDTSGADTYKLIVRPGCDSEIAAFGLTTWRLDRDQIVLTGRSGSWRFAESDPTTWEKMPLSTDPLLLVRR